MRQIRETRRPRRSEIKDNVSTKEIMCADKTTKSIDNLDISHVIKGKRRSEKTKDRSMIKPILGPIEFKVAGLVNKGSKTGGTPQSKSDAAVVSSNDEVI